MIATLAEKNVRYFGHKEREREREREYVSISSGWSVLPGFQESLFCKFKICVDKCECE